MALSITSSDLSILDDEPRVQDLRLAEALGFERPRTIRQLIERNRAEINSHGEVCCTAQQTSSKGGRPGLEYWLNEAQALLVCMFSRTDQAARVRRELVQVFMAWRRGKAAAQTGTGPTPGFQLDDQPLGLLWAKIALLKEVRLGHGPRAAARLYGQIGLPPLADSQLAELDDGRECLRLLLGASAVKGEPSSEFTVATELAAALDGDDDVAEQMRELGLRVVVDEERRGVLVANHSWFLNEMFEMTVWRKGGWAKALRRLPGCQPAGAQRYGLETQRGTFIPEALVDELSPPSG